jgi:hypothetical protein
VSHSPWCHTVTLTLANANYNLDTLLRAIDPRVPKHCQMLQIQANVGLGTDLIYIGDAATLTALDRGVELVETQVQTIQSLESNLIFLADIALRSNGAGHSVNILMVTR